MWKGTGKDSSLDLEESGEDREDGSTRGGNNGLGTRQPNYAKIRALNHVQLLAVDK